MVLDSADLKVNCKFHLSVSLVSCVCNYYSLSYYLLSSSLCTELLKISLCNYFTVGDLAKNKTPGLLLIQGFVVRRLFHLIYSYPWAWSWFVYLGNPTQYFPSSPISIIWILTALSQKVLADSRLENLLICLINTENVVVAIVLSLLFLFI